MHLAHNIRISRKTVIFDAGDEEQESHRYKHTSARRARQFAASLAAGTIRVNNLGQLRFRAWDRKGNEMWISNPSD